MGRGLHEGECGGGAPMDKGAKERRTHWGAGAENMTLAFKGKLGIFFAHAHAMLFIILNSILPLPTLEIT